MTSILYTRPLEHRHEDGYGTWLFKCPTCHITWTTKPTGNENKAPYEKCPNCKESVVKAGF